jgi:hypothetical protein
MLSVMPFICVESFNRFVSCTLICTKARKNDIKGFHFVRCDRLQIAHTDLAAPELNGKLTTWQTQ